METKKQGRMPAWTKRQAQRDIDEENRRPRQYSKRITKFKIKGAPL